MIIDKQIKMARAGLNWSVHVLAEKAGTTANTISRIERGGSPLVSTLNKIQRALESAGIEFIMENRFGPGVRLRKSQKPTKP